MADILHHRISTLDFSPISTRFHLTNPTINPQTILTEYRRFLCLKVLLGDIDAPSQIAPSALIEEFWHQHVLHTKHYRTMCQLLGVPYVDYDPGAKNDMVAREKGWVMMWGMYKTVYGREMRADVWQGVANVVLEDGSGSLGDNPPGEAQSVGTDTSTPSQQGPNNTTHNNAGSTQPTTSIASIPTGPNPASKRPAESLVRESSTSTAPAPPAKRHRTTPDPQFHVNISVYKGSTHRVNASPKDTIHQLELRVAKVVDHSLFTFRLFNGGLMFEDRSATLAAEGVESGEELELFPAPDCFSLFD
ncbi:hypothetical protein HDV00_012273 [Rhizophlyctis rosea]|nr:hypothetical protein HDV00_012273 [Rhizophlyctis rosea]